MVASYEIQVSIGSPLDVFSVDTDQYSNAKNGQSFLYYVACSKKHTSSLTMTCDLKGSYYLIITVSKGSYGNSTYHASIKYQQSGAQSNTVVTTDWVAFGAIMGIIIAIMAVIFYYKFLRVTRPTTPSPGFMTACRKCGEQMKFIDKYQRWYCQTCKEYGSANIPPPK